MRKVITAMLLGGFMLPAMAADPVRIAAAVNADPESVNEVRVGLQRAERYRELAATIGFHYDETYGYQEWADINRMHDVGIAGEYETLACSTGPVPDLGVCDSARNAYWESVYYRNHDLTVVHAVRNEGERSYVQLLKLARGRVPDLHRR